MMKFYLAFDPGKSNGWASFTLDGVPIDLGEVAYGKELQTFLSQSNPAWVVCEEFQLITETTNKRTGKKVRFTPKWDKVVAARAIGMIEARALELDVPIHFQRSSILPNASQAFGIQHKKYHMLDAELHGLYYAWKHLGKLPPDRPVSPIKKELVEARVVTILSLGDIAKASKKRARG